VAKSKRRKQLLKSGLIKREKEAINALYDMIPEKGLALKPNYRRFFIFFVYYIGR
jgi:hypothetical protein